MFYSLNPVIVITKVGLRSMLVVIVIVVVVVVVIVVIVVVVIVVVVIVVGGGNFAVLFAEWIFNVTCICSFNVASYNLLTQDLFRFFDKKYQNTTFQSNHTYQRKYIVYVNKITIRMYMYDIL